MRRVPAWRQRLRRARRRLLRRRPTCPHELRSWSSTSSWWTTAAAGAGWAARLPAVDSVSLTASPGRTLGLVGESGSGKTTVARAALGLIPATSGTVTVAGMEWHKARGADRARMRAAIQLVFQDPYASLNPRWRVRQIVAEPLGRRPPGQRADPADLLQRVGLPVRFLDRYPDELSGGQRQRVGIARALASEPEILIADEPVSALDVSVQAQVINLLTELRDDLGVGLVFIAHDLAVVRHVSDDLAVMYRGRIVEQGPAEAIFSQAPASLHSGAHGVGTGSANGSDCHDRRAACRRVRTVRWLPHRLLLPRPVPGGAAPAPRADGLRGTGSAARQAAGIPPVRMSLSR